MSFLVIVFIALTALGVVAALLSMGGDDEPIRTAEGDCASCSSKDDGSCKLAGLMEESKKRKCKSTPTLLVVGPVLLTLTLLLLTACSTQKNTANSRWWHSFTARYNTYYNGSQAFIDGCVEKEKGNKDNFTELIPLYTVGNKQSRELGKGNFDRAIEKSEKAIKQHSIKHRPEWNKTRRKTAKDIEWLSRREYNPFIWHAWLLLGKSQFQKGAFDEAAATFSYMSRLYQTQPAISGIARAWLAKSYTEQDWLYDAEDVITKMRRDSMDYRAVKDWDYTYANFYIRSGRYEEAIPYLRKVIKHERRSYQRAREWYLMGQLQALLGHREEAYQAFRRVGRQNPPYELEFNARIAQTEVMAKGHSRQMISRLRRMAASDNNKEYLDQVYYAIGNIYMTESDTAHAIEAYEQGNKKATRNGIEKGVLLLTLGNLYWELERYNDAQRCYGEAIGLLDKDRPDYARLSERSKVLDDLVPYTDAIHLQDSLQQLAAMPEAERNKAIDRVIEALVKKEKEEQRAREEAEAERIQQQQAAVGNRMQNGRTQQQQTPTGTQQQQGLWYFYNPQAVSQGKQTFQQQWGKRENVDNWQRTNLTVLRMSNGPEDDEEDSALANDSTASETAADSLATAAMTDSAALDPHKREYYLAQIPFTEEQRVESDNIIKDGLLQSGIIFKDRLDNLPLGEKSLTRLTTQYADYEQNDLAWYHLFLLYSRMGRPEEANRCLAQLKAHYAESQWTVLLSDPYFAENARFGVHIEDSLYAATYEAFRQDRHAEVSANARLSAERFPLGANRPKFLLIEGLSLLNDGNATACMERLQSVVEQYPQSEVSPLAGMILKGVQEGRTLYGGKFDVGDIWSRREASLIAGDSTRVDTLSIERNASFVFLLAYPADSINQNQLLFELARYNFTNFLVRNFDISVDNDQGIGRMLISGFLSYDEALQYARQLYANPQMAEHLRGLRHIIISEPNLRLLGTSVSYQDYDIFFDRSFSPMPVSSEPLLTIPEQVQQEQEPEPPASEPEATDDDEDTDIGLPDDGMPHWEPQPVQPESTDLPELPEAPESPATPDLPELPEAPESPATPDLPEMPAAPEVPEVPAPSGAPADPNFPDDLDIYDTPAPPSSGEYIEFDDDFYR